MKVLMFTRCIGAGGTEKVIIQLCKALKEKGYTPIVCASEGRGVKQIEQEQIKYYRIPDMQKKSPLVMFTIVTRLYKIIKQEGIDIVHTHHRMAAFYTRVILPFVKVKFINTIHNTFEDKKIMTRYAYGKAYNVAVGQSVKDYMKRYYNLSDDCISVVYNAVDNRNIKLEDDERIQQWKREGSFIVGNIGRINTQKGFEYYIRAAEILKRKKCNIKFLIIGDGVLYKEIKAMTDSLQLNDIVYFYGFSDNIFNVIRQLDLVVLSSLWEGFPLTPIETFSMGKTIVATDVPGTIEIVKDGQNGIVVPIKDEKGIAYAVEQLMLDEEKRSMLEKNAYKTYEDKFSYDAFCNNYLSIYRKMINTEKTDGKENSR